MSAAIFFCSSGDDERAKVSFSCSILGSSAQPNQPPFLPRPPIEKLTIGLTTSAATQLVKNMFQTPSFGGFWLVRRVTTVCQSVACTSTLKPASRNCCATTIGCAFNVTTSPGAMTTTGVPSYPDSASSFLASAMPLPFTSISEPSSVASGVSQTKKAPQIL